MFSQGSQGHLNPASMYNNLGNANQFDINQFTQGLQNGNSGTPTPNFQNQTFQPGSVIPAKRPHDGMSGSPVQAQGSRSQTPNYGGFQGQQAGGQQFTNAPTPYSHLQQTGSNNATPSPTMPNQQFRPPQQQQQQRMQNASPSPFGQQQGNFGNQMSPSTPQNPNLPTSMPQSNQMGGFNQQMGMNTNMGMQGMQNSMPGQMNNMANLNRNDAQKIYQMRLMQQQQQLRNSGMIPPRSVGGQQNQLFNSAAQQPGGGQMPNGQAGGQIGTMSSMQNNQMKRANFLKTLQGHAQQQGRQFNPSPTIGGRPVDLFALWTITTQMGGSQNVDRGGQWQTIANKMGFSQPQFPTAPEELKQLHANNILQYERLWFTMRAQQKQEQARQHAHQMAGLGGLPQGSPTKTMQQMPQQNQCSQVQQNQQSQPQPQATPVQANAQLPQNGMITPQQQMLQHRRSSSLRKPEQMTPQAASQAITAPSPQSAGKGSRRSPTVKQEPGAAVMKSEEAQSMNYEPSARSIELDGGYDIPALFELGVAISRNRPDMPTVDEMGFIDTKAIMLSLGVWTPG